MELHLLLNSFHTPLLDTFFKYYSMIAEGPVYILALLPLFWKKYRMTLFFGLSELTAGGVVQVLKHIFSSDRPIVLFENYRDAVLPIVQGVHLHHSNSFPSGHASTFFVFCTCCALFLAYRHGLKRGSTASYPAVCCLLLILLAALGAYSRVYLSQHFLSDVCVGSIIGFLTPCLLFHFFGEKLLNLKNNDTTTHDETNI
jgi:membrane-associated phospholipid phosphatase